MNAKVELLKLADGEEILAVCIGGKGWDWDERPVTYYSKGKVAEALKLLDFKFDSGYGGEEGYSLYAWTKTKVIIKGTYDGAEWYKAIPRNPDRTIKPESIGG